MTDKTAVGAVVTLAAALLTFCPPLGAQEPALQENQGPAPVSVALGDTGAESGETARMERKVAAPWNPSVPAFRPYSASLLLSRQLARAGIPSFPIKLARPSVQQRNRAGIPWIIAGSVLIVGGAIIGDDVGTVLMTGGVGSTAYGLFIYF